MVQAFAAANIYSISTFLEISREGALAAGAPIALHLVLADSWFHDWHETMFLGKPHNLPNKTLSSLKLRKGLGSVSREIVEGDDFDFGIAAGWFWKCSSGEAD